MSKNVLVMILGVVMLTIISACSGSAQKKAMKENLAVIGNSKPVMVTKSGSDNRPSWCNESRFQETDTGFLFSGGFMGGADYALTLRLAKGEATKNLLESVEIKARSEFASTFHGGNRTGADIGRYVTDVVSWTVENLRVRGIREREIYFEQVFDPMRQAFLYNAWVKLEIPRGDYLRAKVEAAERLVEKTTQEKDDEARERALEMLERLRGEGV